MNSSDSHEVFDVGQVVALLITSKHVVHDMKIALSWQTE